MVPAGDIGASDGESTGNFPESVSFSDGIEDFSLLAAGMPFWPCKGLAIVRAQCGEGDQQRLTGADAITGQLIGMADHRRAGTILLGDQTQVFAAPDFVPPPLHSFRIGQLSQGGFE